MNADRPSSDDPRLTAYALGELAADERPAVEAALRANPALRATLDAIRMTAANLESALAAEAYHGAAATDRAPTDVLNRLSFAGAKEQLSDGAGAGSERNPGQRPARRRGKLLAFPQLYYIVSGLAVAGFAVMVAMYRDTFEAAEKLRAENLRLAMERRSILAREPSREGTIVVQLRVPSPSTDPADTEPLESTPALANNAANASPRENTFRGARQNPLSTFSTDIDTVSYAHLRRFIAERQLPPVNLVRIEELLNHFSYQYPAPVAATSPEPAAPVAASLEVAEAPWTPSHRLVRIGLKGREVSTAERPAANLVFLIDISGSMNAPNRLPLVKESMRMLIGELRPDDRVAIVTYAGNSGLALPSTPVAKAREIFAVLDSLTPGGDSNGTIGLQLAYDIAKANHVSAGLNRVILCTDGDIDFGPGGAGEILRFVEEKAKASVYLTVLGFGLESVDDTTLELLADKGNGHYGYITSRREAQKFLVDEVTSTLVTIARDVRIQVEFNPTQVASYRLIGYENRAPNKEDFSDDDADASEMGSGETVTALYEIVPVGSTREPAVSPATNAGSDEFRYQGNARPARVPAAVAGELLTVKFRYKEPTGDVSKKLEFPLVDRGTKFATASADFRFAAAVAEFGMILRGSPHRGAATLRDVIAWAATANSGPDDDPGGYRAEFIDLVRRTQSLME